MQKETLVYSYVPNTFVGPHNHRCVIPFPQSVVTIYEVGHVLSYGQSGCIYHQRLHQRKGTVKLQTFIET